MNYQRVSHGHSCFGFGCTYQQILGDFSKPTKTLGIFHGIFTYIHREYTVDITNPTGGLRQVAVESSLAAPDAPGVPDLSDFE